MVKTNSDSSDISPDIWELMKVRQNTNKSNIQHRMPKNIQQYFIIPYLQYQWKWEQDKAGVYENVELQEGVYCICASGGSANERPAIAKAVVQLEHDRYTVIVGSG